MTVTGTSAPETPMVEFLETAPEPSQLAACPLCHTAHPSLTHDALDSGREWRCPRCDQRWDARRFATVAAYAAWVVAQEGVYSHAAIPTSTELQGAFVNGERVSEALPE